MTVAEFTASLGGAEPTGISTALRALWHESRGDGSWHRAHDLLQDDNTADGSWVHAYLHRREGDLANAGYWYRRAGRDAATGSLESEWEFIVAELLANP